MKIEKILVLPNVKIILLLYQKEEVRYTELSKLIKSRGALSNAFKELTGESLIQRGKDIAQEFSRIKSIIVQ